MNNPATPATSRTRALVPTFLAILLSPALAHAAEQYVWRNVTVGGGGYIPGIVFSRLEQGLAYLRSDMGGAYRWDASARRWVPLQDAIGESSYHGIESIALDPVDANVVYLAAGMYRDVPAAILRSLDRGKTWEINPVGFRMGGNEDGRGMGERLAIDPHDPNVLYFGSRHDGLQRSSDRGRTWAKVESFPLIGRGLVGWDKPANAGLSFVVCDPKTRSIFVGSGDPGEHHLFRSDDDGATWRAVEGGPGKEMLPAQAQIDDAGQFLYLTYGTGLPPTNVPGGCVMKLDVRSGAWTDITPDQRPDRPSGGYCGLSLDRQKPETLAVATMNRWSPIDTVWRSADGGATWRDLAGNSAHDVSATPFVLWGKPKPKLGWWMSALAIDPFDSDHACYATGATIFATREFSKVSSGEPTRWTTWVEGIEQTAVITLTSPTAGAALLSGFGDIGGFVHDDVNVSPPKGMYENPQFGNTNTIDFAGKSPNVVVRSGRPNDGQAALGWSDDGGHTWQPLAVSPRPQPADPADRRERAHPAIAVNADGTTFMVMTRPTPLITRDRGKTWMQVKGLPANTRPVADRVDAARFYAMDFDNAKIFASANGGASFSAVKTTGLPASVKADNPTWHEAPWPLVATLDRPGELWLVSKSGLFRSSDGGATFAKIDGGGVQIEMLSFGKPPAGREHPALFAIGKRDALRAVWRSDDAGKSWLRINDDQHHWGTRFRCIAADPKQFGRVYVGTDGRGILYGEPVKMPEAK